MMLNHLYQSGEMNELVGGLESLPQMGQPGITGASPMMDMGAIQPGTPQDLSGFTTIVQTIPDPDRLNQPPLIRYGPAYGKLEPEETGSLVSPRSIKPYVEIPGLMPALPTAQATASSAPILPGVLPIGTGVSDGGALLPSSETPVAPASGDIRMPSLESPAILAPPTGGTPMYLPPSQAAPNIAGDPVGVTRQTAGTPSIGATEPAGDVPNEPAGLRALGSDTALDPGALLAGMGRPYFLEPEALGGMVFPTPPAPAGGEFLPVIPGALPGLGQFLPPPVPGIPASVPAAQPGAPYIVANQPAASALDEPRNDREFDMSGVRADFPLLHQRINGKPLVWLDNAATSQKPRAVIDAIKNYYETINSNVHRGAHTLAARATEAYEGAREKVQRFIGAEQPEEIVFTRGATEAINLVANSYGRRFFAPGDEVIVTVLEHHSNIVPWMMLKECLGIKVRVAPVDDNGDLMMSDFTRLFNPRTKLAAFTHVANSIGTVMPVQEMTAFAHANGVKVLIDGAQSVPHFRVNMKAIDADFYILAGHKVFGPTGIGALYGKREILDSMPPWQGGGSMIDKVTFDEITYAPTPQKFEAGTPIIAAAVGLGAALDYLTQIGFERATAYESSLMGYALRALSSIKGVRLIGNPRHRAGSISLVVEGIHTEQVGKFLDREGIAVRAGHHCAQPALARFGLQRTVRPSLAIYNTIGEIDRLVEAILKAQRELK